MSGRRRHCVLRRQCRDTNQNIKRSVYCRYRKRSLTFRALALRQKQRATLEMLDFTFHIGSPPTFLYFDLCRDDCLYISEINEVCCVGRVEIQIEI